MGSHAELSSYLSVYIPYTYDIISPSPTPAPHPPPTPPPHHSTHFGHFLFFLASSVHLPNFVCYVVSYFIIFVAGRVFIIFFFCFSSPRTPHKGGNVAKTLYYCLKSGCPLFCFLWYFPHFGEPSGSPLGTLLIIVDVPGALLGDS